MPGQDDTERFAFDRFPRGFLAFGISRRKFLPTLVSDFLVTCEQENGRPTYKLSELGTWSDEKLGTVIPRVVKGCRIHVKDGYVWGQPLSVSQGVKIFLLDSPARIAFNEIDATHSIAEISADLASQTGWDPQRSFAYVRGLFLWLVLAQVCQPVI